MEPQKPESNMPVRSEEPETVAGDAIQAESVTDTISFVEASPEISAIRKIARAVRNHGKS